jgi:hypothetical protein
MPLTLEEYAEYLDKRGDLSWPAPPTIAPRKARPHLVGLPGIRGVVWSCYGVLVAISGGELVWLPQDKFVAELAFEKLVREFKLWQAMTRRPGNPAEHLRVMYQTALDEQQFQAGGRDRYPEVRAEKVWEAVFKKLKPSEFNFDPLFYGSLDEFCLKVAYFYQRSIQGTQAMPGALAMLQWVSQHLEFQGLLADGQAFSWLHIQRGLQEQGWKRPLEELLPPRWQVWSYPVGGRKPSERLFREMLNRLQQAGLEPTEVLLVGCRIEEDIAPARRWGFRTALFVGDKQAVRAKSTQLADPRLRPDVLLTDFTQLRECLAGNT